MATIAYKYARSTYARAISGSSQNWITPENVYASDNSYATTVAGLTASQYTNYLVARDFGFMLPNDAIVTGIQIRIEKEGTHVKDFSLRLTLEGGATLAGDDLAAKTTAWPDTDTKVVQGGVAETWGLCLWGSDVNSSKFGCAIACKADATGDTPAIDGVEIQVTYTDLTESLKTSGDLQRGRDIYMELQRFMSDKNTAKRFMVQLKKGIWTIDRLVSSLV